MVDAKIAEKRVMVFSKSYCPFCEEAKKIFSSYVRSSKLDPRDYEVMEIEDHPNCQNIQDYLRSITGARSVSTFDMSMLILRNIQPNYVQYQNDCLDCCISCRI